MYLSESEDGAVNYVTTEKQFGELMRALETQGDKWEKQLISTLKERKEEITRSMRMTKLLTNQKKGSRQSYLDILDGGLGTNEQIHLYMLIQWNLVTIVVEECATILLVQCLPLL